MTVPISQRYKKKNHKKIQYYNITKIVKFLQFLQMLYILWFSRKCLTKHNETKNTLQLRKFMSLLKFTGDLRSGIYKHLNKVKFLKRIYQINKMKSFNNQFIIKLILYLGCL